MRTLLRNPWFWLSSTLLLAGGYREWQRGVTVEAAPSVPVAVTKPSASGVLIDLWKETQSTQADRVAFYLGLAAFAHERPQEALRWMDQARIASNGQFPEREALYALLGRGPNPETSFVAEVPEENSKRFDQAIEQVAAARKAVETAQTPEEKVLKSIALAGWLTITGELASHPERGNEKRSTLANDCFDEAKQLRAAFVKAIEGDAKTWNDTLGKEENALFAMHYDAMKVRDAKIGEKVSASREDEKKRLAALRSIAKAYRTTTESYALIGSLLALKDPTAALKAHDDTLAAAITQIREQSKILADLDKQSDYYAMGDEGFDPAEPNADALKVLSGTWLGHLDALRALVTFRQGDYAKAVMEATPLVKSSKLALYVRALANETQAIAETKKDVAADRAAAQKLLDAAKADFEELNKELVPEKAELPAQRVDLVAAVVALQDAATPLQAEVKERLAKLTSPDYFTQKSSAASVQGNVKDAITALDEGLTLHQEAELFLDRAEARIRSGQVKQIELAAKELQEAIEQGLVKKDDYRGALLLAKASIAQYLQSPMDAAPLVTAQTQMEAALDLAKDPASKATCQAYLAFTLAHPAAKGSKDEGQQNRAKLLADDAAVSFKDADEKLKGPETLDTMRLREALVMVNMALGYQAAATQPDYRRTASEAFARALKNASLLPISTGQPVNFGEPLLNALSRRPENASAKELKEEQKYREIFSSFARGTVSLQLNRPQESRDELATALKRLNTPDDQYVLDSTETLDQNAIGDELLGIQALADLEAKPTTAAKAREVAQRLLARSKVTASPVLLFAYIRALEEGVVRDGLAMSPEQVAGREAVLAILAKIETAAQSESVRARYPFLPEVTQQLTNRWRKPEVAFLEPAKALREQNRLADADRLLVEGLGHHPDSQPLWSDWAETQIYLTEAQSDLKADVIEQLLKTLTDKAPAGANRFFAEGVLYTRLSKLDEAQAAFTKAVDANDAKLSQRAKAKLTLVQLQLGMVE